MSKEGSQAEETDALNRVQTVEEIKQIDMEQSKQKAIAEKDLVNTVKLFNKNLWDGGKGWNLTVMRSCVTFLRGFYIAKLLIVELESC